MVPLETVPSGLAQDARRRYLEMKVILEVRELTVSNKCVGATKSFRVDFFYMMEVVIKDI